MSKFLYPIKNLKVETWIKYWLEKRSSSLFYYVLSELLTGTSFHLENTANKKFKEFAIKGNSEQETTTGKNKLKVVNNIQTINGITFTPVYKNGLLQYVNANGTATDNAVYPLGHVGTDIRIDDILTTGNYILSDGVGDYTNYFTQWTNGSVYVNTGIGSSINIEEDSNYRTVIYIRSGVTVNNLKFYPMIRLESVTDNTYEPYTGGQASPNVDYPSERYSAGANGSITEKIYYDLKQNPTILNALLNIGGGTLSSDNYERTLYVKCKPNKTYKIQKKVGSRLRVDERSAVPTTGSANVNLQYSDTASSLNYTTSANANYLLISFYNTSRDTISQEEMLTSIKIEDVAITQTYTIPTQQEMRDIKDSNGNVIAKDEFIEKDDNWYERHNVARVIFDGTETWVYDSTYKYFRCPTYVFDKEPKVGQEPQYSNQFVVTNDWASTFRDQTDVNMMYHLIPTGNKVCIRNTNYDTPAGFASWLAQEYANGTPVYVDYISAEPTDLPCTQEQIDVLENLPHTFKDVTNINSDDEVPANLNIKYWSVK